jgi:phage terminase large subunit
MRIDLPARLEPLTRPKRIKVVYGGRGGGKTVALARLVLLAAVQRSARVLCLREHMNSIEESVHGALTAEIGALGLGGLFEVQRNKILGPAGAVVVYRGLARNIESIKSMHDFDIAWVEEAETVTGRSIDVLEPTIRRPGSEIWYSFNPDDEFGAVYARYVKPHLGQIAQTGVYEDEGLTVVKVGLEDNPFAPQELKDASALMRKTDLRKWMWIWGGECYTDYAESIIKPEWVEAAIDAHLKFNILKPLGVRSLGFDLADEGRDSKAVVMRHGPVIIKAAHWDHGDIETCLDIGFEHARAWGADQMVYDADGLGAAMKVGLDKRIEGGRITVTPYHGAARVDSPELPYLGGKANKDAFRNRRAQYYWRLRDRFEATYNLVVNGVYSDPAGMISLSSDLEGLDLLRSELVKPRRKRGANDFIQIESKEEMRARGVRSPNMADALVMSFANPAPTGVRTVKLNFKSEWG